MKISMLVAAFSLLCTVSVAQNDTIEIKSDTIKVGNIIVIKNNNDKYTAGNKASNRDRYYKSRWKDNTSTNWLILDLGFANFDDKTNYALPEVQSFVPGPAGAGAATSGDFDTKTGSFNLNLWLFMQRLSLYKKVVNLKYGVGIELYKYYYKSDIRYIDGREPYIERTGLEMSRNKLAFDYVTVPFMLNINPNGKSSGIDFSLGASVSYLYGARNKQRIDGAGRQKFSGDFNLERWKLSYIGEVGLGPVRLYGSYSINPLHQYGVEHHPYAVGVRFSRW